MSRIPQTELAAVMRALRESRGLSQESVASRLGVDRTTITRYENGRVFEPDPKLLERLEATFAVPSGTLSDCVIRTPDAKHSPSATVTTWSSFPYERAANVVGRAQVEIRILHAWIPDIQFLIPSIAAGLGLGARLRILVLNPEDDAALSRLRVLGITDPTYPMMQLKKLYADLSANITPREDLGKIVRLYVGTPAIELMGTESTSLIGVYWRSGPSLQLPHIEVDGSSWFGNRATQEFELMWSESTDLV